MPLTATNIANIVSGGAKVVIGSDLGAIKDSVTITPTVEILTVDLEQELTPSKAWPMGRRWTIDFTVCEPTLANIKIAWDVVRAVGGAGPFTLDIGSAELATDMVLQPRALVLSSIVPGNVFIRSVFFHACIIETPAPMVFSKRQEVNLKQTFTALYDYAQTPDRVGLFSDANV